VAAPSGAPLGALRGAIDLAPLVARSAQSSAPPAQQPTPRPAGEQGPAPDVVFDAGDADFATVVELSRTVPVLVALVAEWSTPSRDLVPVLSTAVRALNGRMALAVVDTDASPQLAAAFQAQSVPTVAAVLAGRPLSLFAGSATAEQLAPLLEQVLELAAQNGVSGTIAAAGMPAPGEEAGPAPARPPHHAEAYEAIDRQDYAEAARHFRLAIAQNPRDTAAVAALAQVELLERLGDVDPSAARAAAAEDPKDVAAQLTVADLDLSGGHVEDAFSRVLDVIARTAGDDRTAARERLLAYFEMVGTEDPRVSAARRRLSMLLY
jgi:putative thioredoxin